MDGKTSSREEQAEWETDGLDGDGRAAEAAAEDAEFAARLKRAALAAGYPTAAAVARALQETEANISRWWSGSGVRPSLKKLRKYAKFVNRPLWWFYLRGGDGVTSVLYDLWMQAVEQGAIHGDNARAFEEAAGDPTLLNRRQRQQLARGTPAVQARLDQLAGGSFPALTPAERRPVLEVLLAETLAGHLLEPPEAG